MKAAQQNNKKNPQKLTQQQMKNIQETIFLLSRIPGCTDTYWILTLVLTSVKVSSDKKEDTSVPRSCLRLPGTHQPNQMLLMYALTAALQ